MSPILRESSRWRAKAEEARTMGEMMTNAVARDSLLEIAERYDRLAERMETFAARNQSRNVKGIRTAS